MTFRRQHTYGTRTTCEAGTPLRSEYVHDTTLNSIRVGDGATLGGFLLKRWRYFFPLSPAQITSAVTNDYNPTDLAIGENIFLTSNQAGGITGLAGGAAGSRVTLINRGTFDISLYIENALSAAANRFSFESDIILRPKSSVSLQYSATDSRWMRADGGNKFSVVPQELVMAGVIAPAQITANQNDYAPFETSAKTFALASIVRLSSDASRNITGLVDARDGVVKTIINVGTNPIVLKNADAGSTAANRFDFGADVTLAAKQSVRIRYDATDSRWKLEASTAGAAVGAGAVTAQTLAASAMGSFVGMINGTIVPSVAGSALTIALKTLAGADPSGGDPVYVLFRNATAAAGDYTVLTVTAATSLVISSGSSMGVAANNQAFKLWVLGFNDAGTFRLGAINCLNYVSSAKNIFQLAGFGIASSTAEGGAGGADNAHTFYTGVAVTSKAYVPLAYMSWTGGLAATGTWSAGPTRTQLFGANVPLPGTIVQDLEVGNGATSTGTTTIPTDNTIPQNTEGDQYFSQTITPSDPAHLMDVEADALISNSAAAIPTLTACVFQDNGANAIAVASVQLPQQCWDNVIVRYRGLPGTASATIYKLRAGGNVAGTTTLNGYNSAGYYGGTFYSYLRVKEIAT